MKKLLALIVLALVPATARAQVEGLHIEGGAVFLTKSGKLNFGTSAIESDAGWAVRGRLRYGVGFLSVAGDVQASNQKYGGAEPGAPQNLDATFVGVTAALHPVKLGVVAPYAEIGRGKLFYGDDRINKDAGSAASSYGLGVLLGGEKVSLDVELRLLRQTGLELKGTGQEFKYDPKMLSLMLSIRL